MRERYIKDLESFTDKLAAMGVAVNEQVHKAIKAFQDVDASVFAQLDAEDKHINHMANEIEKEAYRLIALQQPVAEDLRLIFSILNASNDLERIADHAVAIARNVSRSETEKVDNLAEIINEMSKKATEMLTDVMEAFAKKDKKLAEEIALRDHKIDHGLKQLYRESAKRMQHDSELVSSGINYLGIGNSIERIGDYITNICERIVYLSDAEIVELNQ